MLDLLPDDLIVEIIGRLPAKTAMKLKLVSKAWHHLISNNVSLLRLSAAAAAQPCGFLFRCAVPRRCYLFTGYACYPDGDDCVANSEGFVDSYSSLLPFYLFDKHDFECCNGLLLFVRREILVDRPRYHVCNPITGQCVAIPNPRPNAYPFPAALAFDPAKSPHYKVARFIYWEDEDSSPRKLEVFSSDTGKWVRRMVRLSIQLPPVAAKKSGCIRRTIYLDGMLYKLTLVNYLLRFDLNGETDDVAIELPHKNINNVSTGGCVGFIGMAAGSLYYSNHDESRLTISIWLLEDCCKVHPFWALRHRISMDYLTSKYPEVSDLGFHFDVYAIHPAAPDIVFLGTPGIVLSYDLESNKFQKVFKMKRKRRIVSGQHFFHLYAHCYVVLSNFSQQ